MDFVNHYQEKLDSIGFSWSITDYTEDSLKLKIEFDEAESVSSDFEHNDSIVVTFWDTQYFKSKKGAEVPFGSTATWEVIRQMPDYDSVSVESALGFSHFLLAVIGLFVFLLILFCGPLLPIWMFINSMQLIVHVPLIQIKLPGNAHYFLLDHLKILKLHIFGLNTWIYSILGVEE